MLAMLAAGTALAAGPDQPEGASGWREKPPLAFSRHGAATANPFASEAALRILREGGTALDAAIAAQMVLNVVEPQSSGIGGGGFLLHYSAGDGRLSAYDGRETAPAAAAAERFLRDGRPQPFPAAATGGMAVGVPGLVAMLEAAHRAHGRLPWARLFAPAIGLAEAGFPVSPRLAMLLAADPHLRHSPGARELYYRPDGSPLASGALLRNPALAGTLRRVAEQGARAIAGGEVGRAFVEAVRTSPRGEGDLAPEDLAAYRPVVREPLCGAYRGYRVCGMPPPSSGGVAVLQILGILERVPFRAARPGSAEAIHWFAEAGRLAFADRARYLGDPAFVAVPVRELLAPDYLAGRAAALGPDRSLGRAPAGELALPRADAGDGERPATTHLSVVDGQGNAVALTSSIEDAFGSRILAAGVLLNNQLTDFSFVPEREGRPVANRVQPGKRPLSSMAPTMVFDRDGALLAVLGSPGGNHIINYVARTLVALIDWRLPAGRALAMPHFGSRNGPTLLEPATPEAVQRELEARGHEVVRAELTSGLHLILRTPAGWIGAADPRREGEVRGE
ncbi:MAG: gamma-glutamyltransferase [Rhodocyclaceae bacterium]|nr:gamma-glutamyltransferase [Rhodocyclaceae bacterium]